MVVVSPSFVMGPAQNPEVATSESITILKQLGDGTMKMGVPNLGMGIVDVRDLAFAHYQAGFVPDAKGRHIISGHNSTLLEASKILHKSFGESYPVPKSALPKWLVMLVGPLINKSLSRKFIRGNVDVPWKADNSKSKKSLGVTYRPLQDTMIDSFQVLIDTQMVSKK